MALDEFPYVETAKLFLGAHPDDVEVTCGGLIKRTLDLGFPVWYLCATNGAPSDLTYYPRYNCDSPMSYAQMRREELIQAAGILGIEEDKIHLSNVDDQRLAWHVEEFVNNVTELIEKQKPEVIFCPAFEGGHPDHDSLHLITHLSREKSSIKPLVVEYPEYNYNGGSKNFSRFIPNKQEVYIFNLFPEESSKKGQAFNAFASQQKYIMPFLESGIMERELFRLSDFPKRIQFPHPRPLYYETVNIKVNPREVLENLTKFLSGQNETQN